MENWDDDDDDQTSQAPAPPADVDHAPSFSGWDDDDDGAEVQEPVAQASATSLKRGPGRPKGTTGSSQWRKLAKLRRVSIAV